MIEQPPDQNYTYFHADYWENPLQRQWPFHIFCIEEVIRCKPSRLYNIKQPYLLLVLICEGKLHYIFPNFSPVVLSAGDALVIPPMIGYSFESDTTGGNYRKIVAEISGPQIGIMCEMLGINTPSVFEGKKDVFLETVETAGAILGKRNSAELPQLLGISYQLLGQIVQERSEPEGEDEKLLTAAKLLLESDFQCPLTTMEVTRKLKTSRARLERIFRQKLQQTPMGYRIGKKMERAAYFLTLSHSVKEVAFLLGYCNPFYFSSEFKRFYGMSPQVYQRNHH